MILGPRTYGFPKDVCTGFPKGGAYGTVWRECLRDRPLGKLPKDAPYETFRAPLRAPGTFQTIWRPFVSIRITATSC